MTTDILYVAMNTQSLWDAYRLKDEWYICATDKPQVHIQNATNIATLNLQ